MTIDFEVQKMYSIGKWCVVHKLLYDPQKHGLACPLHNKIGEDK